VIDVQWLPPTRANIAKTLVTIPAGFHQVSSAAQQVAQPGLTPVVSPRLLAAERQSVRAIRLLTLGRPDAARRTYQLLESRLAELDTEPDPATRRLLRQAMKQSG
jgi:hypothetical protein